MITQASIEFQSSEIPKMITQASIEFQNNLYESNNPTRRWIHQKRRGWVIDRLNSLSSPTSSVLEVGTGCGIYTKSLNVMFNEVTTIDVNGDFIESAKLLFPKVNSLKANIESFKDSKQYDIILMSEVLEHVSSTKASLDTVYAHLKAGGTFILTTPNKFSTTELVARLLKIPVFAYIAQKIYGEPVAELGHISLRTRRELMTELKDAGFLFVRRDDLSFYLPVIAEFGGEFGKRVLQFCEKQLNKSDLFRNMLWTQCYLLTK